MNKGKEKIHSKRSLRAQRLSSLGKISRQLPWMALRNPKAVTKWIELKLLGRFASPLCYNYPSVVQIEVTNLCNLHCKMCPRDYEFEKAGIKPSSMSFDTFDKIMGEWIQHVYQIHLFGRGEPLMAPDLPKMIKYSAEHGVPFISFTTNGHLLQGEVAETIAGSDLDELRISIDGADEEGYKIIRKVSLQRVKDNIKAFRAICDIPISILTTLSKDNWDSVYRMPELCAELGVTSLRLFPVIPYASLEMDDTKLTQEQKQQYHSFCKNLNQQCRKKGINFIPTSPYAKDCSLPFMMAFIDIKGNLTPCCRLETLTVGNILEHDFSSIWHGTKMTNWRKLMVSRKFPKQCIDLECIFDWR